MWMTMRTNENRKRKRTARSRELRKNKVYENFMVYIFCIIAHTASRKKAKKTIEKQCYLVWIDQNIINYINGKQENSEKCKYKNDG